MFTRFRRRREPLTVHIDPAGLQLAAAPRQTILDAALAAGVAFPNNCRAGGCGTCKCRLLDGQVRELTDASYVLSAEELQSGTILACQSVPRGDVRIAAPGVGAGDAPRHPVVGAAATIAARTPLNRDIVELVVELDRPLAYTAGQYAELRVPGRLETPRSYSMAAAPGPDGDHQLRFHVRRVPDGAFTGWLHDEARVGDALQVTGPYGDFWLRPAAVPIIAVAGGSGLAPILALLDQARRQKLERDVVLIQGARTAGDLYGAAAVDALARQWLGSFRHLPILSDPAPNVTWNGHRGLAHEALGELGNALGDHHIYACGPPAMVDAVVAAAAAAGVAAEHVHYDRFLDRRHTAAAA